MNNLIPNLCDARQWPGCEVVVGVYWQVNYGGHDIDGRTCKLEEGNLEWKWTVDGGGPFCVLISNLQTHK